MWIVEATWTDGSVDFWMCDSRKEAVNLVDAECDYYNGQVNYRKATESEVGKFLDAYVNGESVNLNLGRYIYWCRRHRGLTQTDLAVALDISQASVSDWEHNKVRPSDHMLSELEVFFSFEWPE